MYSESFLQRFWSKVEKTEGCWEWTASKVVGYGQISAGRRGLQPLKAHRVSYEIVNGRIPSGLFCCHKCDNPACVNPDHLFLGTQKDNLDDMYAKGRDKTRAKPRKPRKLSDIQVYEIRNDPRIQREIAADYGVSTCLVSNIKNGRRRQYI